jgi:deoxyribodipyrimidine photolyase
MKLREIVLESALSEIRRVVEVHLLEDVNQYLALTLAQIKNKKKEDLKTIDLDHLTAVIVGLKVLSNSELRQSLSKNDIGIQPNDPKEIFKLFTDVSKDSKDPAYVKKVFDVIAKLTPTAMKKQRSELDKLSSDSDSEKQNVVRDIEQFMHKVSQAYGKLRQSTAGAGKANLNSASLQ